MPQDRSGDRGEVRRTPMATDMPVDQQDCQNIGEWLLITKPFFFLFFLQPQVPRGDGDVPSYRNVEDVTCFKV